MTTYMLSALYGTVRVRNGHLNYQGSCVFTDYLGNYLKENYILPDRRGDPSCESYLDNQKLILKEAKEASAGG